MLYLVTCDEEGDDWGVEADSFGEAVELWTKEMRSRYADDVADGYEPRPRQVTLVSEHPTLGRERRQHAIESIREALGLFPSMVRSGESMTPTAERVLERARADLLAFEFAVYEATKPKETLS